MPATNRLQTSLKAARELGLNPLALYSLYQLGLRVGYLRWRTPAASAPSAAPDPAFKMHPFHPLPAQATIAALLEDQVESLYARADEILAGQFRPFGGELRPMPAQEIAASIHWTAYALGRQPWHTPGSSPVEDVKLIWEPARFGWAYTLARAYHLSQDERYPAAFWRYTEDFLQANPPNCGSQWASAQEVALRLIALSFAIHVFIASSHSTPARLAWLGVALAAHADRIPPTLLYARAQGNNHLLTEALGLYTAGLLLAAHPRAARWQALGWRWLNHALRTQISADGSYVQQSANYHRLMLQAALWAHSLAQSQGRRLPPDVVGRLQAATRWGLALLDPESGRLPNLGPNDGAYIQPLTSLPFSDFRPVLGAAGLAFLGDAIFPAGPWLEMAAWYGLDIPALKTDSAGRRPNRDNGGQPGTVHTLHNPASNSWAYFRVAHFGQRPGHADQLHLDLWWQGLNLAQDPGSYLYNAPPPWENALRGAAVHNTITVDGLDQMTPAGRFLWLDWAQAEILDQKIAPDGTTFELSAHHNGYQQIGLDHERTVQASPDGHWIIRDRILPWGRTQATTEGSFHLARLHWLLPDWPWSLHPDSPQEATLTLESPRGPVRLRLEAPGLESDADQVSGAAEGEGHSSHPTAGFDLVRAGERLSGRREPPVTWGWVSVTYGEKLPALSFSVTVSKPTPIEFTSEWILP